MSTWPARWLKLNVLAAQQPSNGVRNSAASSGQRRMRKRLMWVGRSIAQVGSILVHQKD